MLVRVGVAVEAVVGGGGEAGAEGVFVGVEEDVGAVIFVVTGDGRLADDLNLVERGRGAYSRAQR